jgi:phosphate transport system protein
MEDSSNLFRNKFISSQKGVYNETGEEGDTMVRHIDSELQQLKDLALQMGGYVEKAFEASMKMVTAKDPSVFHDVERFEARINELQISMDEACVTVLAKQAPVAKDLRLVIAITKINTDLERMGDQCVNIALAAKDIYGAWPQITLPPQVSKMIEEVRGMVRSVLDAFARRDVELSQKVLELDDQVDGLKDELIGEMTRKMKSEKDQVEVGLAMIMIARNLERLADHATNIAEEVIYLATGNDVRHGHSVNS